MPAAAFALLIPLLVSCSKTNDDVVLVPVDGVVRLRDGPPLAGVTVAFLGPVPQAAPPAARAPLAPEPRGAGRGVIYENPPIATTDALGRFQIPVPAGRYEVWIGGPADGGIMSQHASTVTLRSSRVTLDLRYEGYRLSGRLIGPGGTALTSGDVFVLSGTSTARASLVAGSYSLLLPADTFAIWANPGAADYNRGVPRVKHEGIILASDSTIDLSVDGFEVTGTVTGPGGIPLDGGWVSAYAPTASAYSPTAADGTYRIYLPGMEYAFTVDPGPGRDSIGVYHNLGILIDADRTLDFNLSVPPPPPPPGP